VLISADNHGLGPAWGQRGGKGVSKKGNGIGAEQ